MNLSSLIKNRNFARQSTSLLVLVGVLLASMPIPLGWKVKIQSGNTPFPCQDCQCGCMTAEQCWTNCCCYSPEERVAWAQEHGVDPPGYAILSYTSAKSTHGTTAPGQPSCCSMTNVTSSNRTSITTQKKSCCSQAGSSLPDCGDGISNGIHELEYFTELSEGKSIVILSMAAAKCHGGGDFTLLRWAILDNNAAAIQQLEPIFANKVLQDEWLPSVSAQPELPPPRSACLA